jgi:hypothetical protein
VEDILKLVTYTARRDSRDTCWEIVRHDWGSQKAEIVQTGILTEKKAAKAQDLWRARERGDA